MAKIQFRRDTAANWTLVNPILASGEVGFETNTGKFKLGNGATSWNSLSYITGATGPRGLTGATGPQGLAGPAGARGSTGPAGPTGPQGLIGPAGPAGDQGEPGAPGANGAVGARGATGPIGPQGIQGPVGPQGIQGAKGNDGSGLIIKGAVSTYDQLPGTAVSGDAYIVTADGLLYVHNGTSFPSNGNGSQFRGPQGVQGIQGPQGVQGPVGNTGPAGPTGPKGADGFVGSDGAPGPTGPQGPIGLTGPAGVTGATGPKGDTGDRRPKMFFIDDYGADPTGVNESNQPLIDAYNAMAGGPGVIVFGVGTYKLFLGLNEAANRLLKPQQGVMGQGSGQTYIDYRGPGAFVEFRDRDFDNWSINHQHGGLSGMTILGWLSGETNSYGVRYGDIWRMRISDVEINGFNRPGCIGLWGDNQYRWSERAFIECVVNQCTECFVFESNTGTEPGNVGSFDYSQYWLSFVVQPNQHAFVLRSGVPGSHVSMNGAEITLTGNCQLSSGPGVPNTGVMFRVGKDNDDAASFSGMLRIGVETSGTTGGEAHYDFMQGTGPSWLIKSKVTATGAINLIPFSGSGFKYGSASAATFAFAGLLKNSPSLGGTGNVQAFQSLQAVSQARGGWFLDLTDAVQTLYVTEATGGTFTISHGGNPTSLLPYNATLQEVETALRALPSIGAGSVWVYKAQARFVNSVMLNEIGFTIQFGGPLGSQDVPLLTADHSLLTGNSPSITVKDKVKGSPNLTYVVGLEGGNIFRIEPNPGTYRLRMAAGNLTGTPVGQYGDSPFGFNCIDIWIKQPDTGGPAIFEPPFFAPEVLSGSTYSFQWVDGQDPILSTTPGYSDVIRLSTNNLSFWVGEHLTKQAAAPITGPTGPAGPTGPQGPSGAIPIRFSAPTATIGVTPTDYAYVPRTITQARMRVSSAPVGSALTAEVQHWNGSAWSTLGTLSIAANSMVESVLTLNQAQVVGNLIRLNITSVGSTTAATGVVVDVIVA